MSEKIIPAFGPRQVEQAYRVAESLALRADLDVYRPLRSQYQKGIEADLTVLDRNLATMQNSIAALRNVIERQRRKTVKS